MQKNLFVLDDCNCVKQIRQKQLIQNAAIYTLVYKALNDLGPIHISDLLAAFSFYAPTNLWKI